MEMQLGGSGTGDDDLVLDADLTRMHMRDGSFAPAPSALAAPMAPKREGTGKVVDVKFLDTDVAQAQLSWCHLLAQGSASPPPRAEAIGALRGQR